MELPIKLHLLSDSPFNESNQELFRPITVEKNDVIEDIRQGPPTCYLISGYRGCGKTSLVLQIHKEISSGADPNNKPELVFVYARFSQFYKREILLRNLIRSLHDVLGETASFKELKTDKRFLKWFGKKKIDPCVEMIERLYDRTFYENSESTTESIQKETSRGFNIDFFTFPRLLVGISVLLLIVTNKKAWELTYEKAISIGISAISVIGLLLGSIAISRKSNHTRFNKGERNRKSLYDEEIADYTFLDLLSKLKSRYRIVFVLDELDKLNDPQRQEFLDFMKPYFLAGVSSYVVVAGQSLFYKYAATKNADDDILNTLFSKFIHVPLLTRIELKALFESLIINFKELNENQQQGIADFSEYLVFESKRIPRKFITLIRQQVYYTNKGPHLSIGKTNEELLLYKVCNDSIDEIEYKNIYSSGMERAVMDYCIMQLYIICHKILYSNLKDIDLDNLIKQLHEENQPHHLHKTLQSVLEEFYELLFDKLQDRNIIKKIEGISGKRAFSLTKKSFVTNAPKAFSRSIFRELLDLRNIVSQTVFFELNSADAPKNFADHMILLEQKGVITMQWEERDEILRNFRDLETLLNDQEIEIRIQEIFNRNKVDIASIIIQVLKYLGTIAAKKVFGNNLTSISSDPSVDLAIQTDGFAGKLFFEFMYRIIDPLPDTGLLLQILRRIEILPANSRFILIVFTKANSGQFEKWQFQFRQLLRDIREGSAYKERLSFVPVSTSGLRTIEEYLQNEKAQHRTQKYNHVFSTQSAPNEFPDRNDDFLNWTYSLFNTDLEIELTPIKSPFWRFGFEFSSNAEFLDRNRKRHDDASIGQIHICVGQPDDNRAWHKAGQLTLTSYNLEIKLNNFKALHNYDGGKVLLRLRRLDDTGITEISVNANGTFVGKQIIDLGMFKYVRIGAWADYITFRIETLITATFQSLKK